MTRANDTTNNICILVFHSLFWSYLLSIFQCQVQLVETRICIHWHVRVCFKFTLYVISLTKKRTKLLLSILNLRFVNIQSSNFPFLLFLPSTSRTGSRTPCGYSFVQRKKSVVVSPSCLFWYPVCRVFQVWPARVTQSPLALWLATKMSINRCSIVCKLHLVVKVYLGKAAKQVGQKIFWTD